jgi:hypothetical protein
VGLPRLRSHAGPARQCRVHKAKPVVERHVKCVCIPCVPCRSLLAFAWDAWGAGVWDRWQLARRQEKRARGGTYDKTQDLEDLSIIVYEDMQDAGLDKQERRRPGKG